MQKAEEGAEGVSSAKRRNGVLKAHLQRRVHKRWAARRGTHKEALRQILDVSWGSASD